MINNKLDNEQKKYKIQYVEVYDLKKLNDDLLTLTALIKAKKGTEIDKTLKNLEPEFIKRLPGILKLSDTDKKYFQSFFYKIVPETEKSREELEAELAEAKQKIAELEMELREINEGRALTKEKIKAILSDIEGFEFLNRVVDLGEPTKKRPKEIPLSKKWDVQAYPKEWSPEDKARAYLRDNWMHYGVNLSYFKNSNIGNGFFKYLERNDINFLLPAACEQDIIQRLYDMK